MKATDQQGADWALTRRWVTRRARWRKPKEVVDGHGSSSVDLLDFSDDLFAAGLVILLVIIVVLPLLALVIDLALIAILLGTAVFSHFVLGRPWRIEASSGSERVVFRVKGWRASRDLMRRSADLLRTGGIRSVKTEFADALDRTATS